MRKETPVSTNRNYWKLKCNKMYELLKPTVNRPPVLGLALLQHVFLIHELTESDILLVQ